MKKPTSKEQYKEGTSLASQLPSSTSVWICMSRITVLLMFPKERREWVVVLRKLNQENIKFAFNHVWMGARNARGGAFALWVIETSSVRGMGYLEKRDRQNLPPIDTLSKRKIDHLALGKFWLLIAFNYVCLNLPQWSMLLSAEHSFPYLYPQWDRRHLQQPQMNSKSCEFWCGVWKRKWVALNTTLWLFYLNLQPNTLQL